MKGQIQHVFGFILVGIVIVVTVLLAIKLIGAMLNSSCEAQEKKLYNQLLEIGQTHDTFGTRQTVEVTNPCNAQLLCIFSQTTTPEEIRSTDIPPGVREQLALAASVPAPKPNIFLVRDNVITELRTDQKFVTEGALCLPNSAGSFTFKTEGRGRTIHVS